MTTQTPTNNNDERPRAVQNGMSQAEYDTWIFLAEKEALDEPYTYAIKQSDLTAFLRYYTQKMVVAELKDLPTDIIDGDRIVYTVDIADRITTIEKELEKS